MLDTTPRQQTGEFRIPTTGKVISLPAQLTRLVGREREVGEVRRLLSSTRLLTLTGAGGSGKTRLALEVAARSAPAFADGVAWVELAPVVDPEHLTDHIASALGVRLEGSDPVEESLVAALHGRELLLALDNCEHLVDECARLVEMLLRRCTRLRVLTTSREALGIGGERSWLVPVLAVPGTVAGLTAEAAADVAAVQLFVERAQDALPSFTLTDANAGAVARICRRVDGLPLAIELAAARVRVLAPEQIAAKLDEGFRVLSGSTRNSLARHRTLREAIGWSYRLLDERERLLLQRLSVFAGDWSLDAAEAVCADDRLEAYDILDILAALVDKSLVEMRETEGTARYRLLETIRQFAAEALDVSGEAGEMHAGHARHFIAVVASAEPDFITSARREAVERVNREIDDLRAVLVWTRLNDPASHLQLAGMLTWFWYSTGLWGEGRRWLESALALPSSALPTRERGSALFGAGAFASLQADPVAACTWLTESVAIARATGDDRLLAYASNYLGMAYIQQGSAEGERHAQEALAWFSATGDLYGHRLALLLLSTLRLAQGDVPASRAHASAAVDLARKFGLDRELGIALQVLSFAVMQSGDFAEAESVVRESLSALRRDPHPLFMGRGLDVLGLISCRRGDLLQGARYFGAAAAEREYIGAALWKLDRERFAPHMEAARTAAGREAFEAAWAEGARARLDVMVDAAVSAAPGASVQPVVPAQGQASVGEAAAGAAASAAALVDSSGPGHATPESMESTFVPVPRGLRVRALGSVEVWTDGSLIDPESWRYARPRELLLYLLCWPEGRTREQIGLAFWREASAAQVKNNFHVTLHHLRKVLGRGEWIVFENDCYRVNSALGVEFDAAVFEQGMSTALRELARENPPRHEARYDSLQSLLELYRGDFLQDLSAGDWHLDFRDRLRQLWVDGMLVAGKSLMKLERYAEAAELYRKVILREELHEEAYRRLMTCLAREGERPQAMRAYDRLVTLLRTDLDAEPEPATAALYDRMRRAEAI